MVGCFEFHETNVAPGIFCLQLFVLSGLLIEEASQSISLLRLHHVPVDCQVLNLVVIEHLERNSFPIAWGHPVVLSSVALAPLWHQVLRHIVDAQWFRVKSLFHIHIAEFKIKSILEFSDNPCLIFVILNNFVNA